jgi:hypothetical protein
MSRTRKGSKGNKEYWTARPGNKHGSAPGKIQKKWTHRAGDAWLSRASPAT